MELVNQARRVVDEWWLEFTEWWERVKSGEMSWAETFWSGEVGAHAHVHKYRGRIDRWIVLRMYGDDELPPVQEMSLEDICDCVLAYQQARDWLNRF